MGCKKSRIAQPQESANDNTLFSGMRTSQIVQKNRRKTRKLRLTLAQFTHKAVFTLIFGQLAGLAGRIVGHT